MEILCLFGLFPNEYLSNIEKDSVYGVQNAANKLQWNIAKGLSEIGEAKLSIVNSLYIGSYPQRYRKKTIPSFDFGKRDGIDGANIGFCNITVVKWLSRYYSVRKHVMRWAADGSGEEKALLVYALTTPFVNIAEYIKRKCPDIKVCVVVPDLPEYMNVAQMNKKGLYYFEKTCEIKMIRRCIRNVDSFVLLTEAMKEWFDHPINYTVVEGIATVPDDGNMGSDVKERTKTVLYAGGIKEEYGVVELAEAFNRLNMPEWELVIYGDGPDLKRIVSLSEQNPNIKVMGSAPNSVVVEAQRHASILVNPRKNQIFTKYSFPSKMIEYMSSGTPVLAYKLDGIPSEYFQYYYHISEDLGMEQALGYVMGLGDEQREAMGQRARRFIMDNKTPEKQCEKIMTLLKG